MTTEEAKVRAVIDALDPPLLCVGARVRMSDQHYGNHYATIMGFADFGSAARIQLNDGRYVVVSTRSLERV